MSDSVTHPDILKVMALGLPEPEIIDECCVCGIDIYEGDDYYDVGGDIVCDRCDYDYMKRFLRQG